MGATQALAPNLPYLRRYARALTGSQSSGDAYVRAVLTAILEGDETLADGASTRFGLYRLFHVMWSSSSLRSDAEAEPTSGVEARLHALSRLSRAALLLTAVEAFSIDETARILGLDATGVEQAITNAQAAIEGELRTRVLIIEDEPLIAKDLENIVSELGHQVIARAQTADEALAKARVDPPGLVLADINLGGERTGLDAVNEILASIDVPVVFITAYPEKLLTGEQPEPTYLIAKPYLPDTVQATVSQALFFHVAKREAA